MSIVPGRELRGSNVPEQPPSSDGDAEGATDDVAAPPLAGESQPLPGADTPATAGAPPDGEALDATPRSQREVVTDELRYWRRTVVLGVIAGTLYALTRWDQSRIPASRRRRGSG